MRLFQVFIIVINFESPICLYFYKFYDCFHLEGGGGIGRQEITWYIVIYKMTALAKRKNKVSKISAQAFQSLQLGYSPVLLMSYFKMLIL